MEIEQLQINGINVQRARTAKFLGVVIDDRLTFQDHVDHVKTKVIRGLAALSRVRSILTRECKLRVYTHLSYCLDAYGLNNDPLLPPLVLMLKRGLRMVEGLHSRESLRRGTANSGCSPSRTR